MDPSLKEQMAAFRYGLIAPIVSRQTPLLPGELKAYLEQAASQTYHVPGSHRTQISVRTLERWLSQYRKNGWEALKPKERTNKGNVRIPAALLQSAIALRKERPERSVEQLIFLLEENQKATPGELAASTLSRHLKKAGVSRKELLQGETGQGYRRFEAEAPHASWQFDFQHTLYMPDPQNPKKKKKAILFAILDDFSRAIVYSSFYWDEKLPRMEDSLKKAILRYGIPSQFYCDNGAAFSSHHLARICGKLGIQLSHSAPYRPQGRGKIERYFRFVDTSFKPEVYQQIEQGRIQTLEQLNQALTAWVDGYYHQRKHGTTKQPPLERLEAHARPMKRKSFAELQEIFLWEENRTVDRAGCISLDGNQYEVDQALCGQRVLLRYDPFDLSRIQVWWDEKQWSNATVLDLTRKYKRSVEPAAELLIVDDGEGQLSFFEAAELRRKKQWEADPVTYAQSGGGQAHE